MVDTVSIDIQTYALSSVELKDLTRNAGAEWPDELIEDYLTIIRNTLSILQGLVDFSVQINENTENIEELTLRVTANEESIVAIELAVANLQTQVTENFIYLHGSEDKSDDFNELSAYVKYNLVTYEGNEYYANQDVVAGAFDELQWDRISTVDNAERFWQHLDVDLVPDPHTQYQFKQPTVSIYGSFDNFTLNTTDSRVDDYTSIIGTSGGDASNGDVSTGIIDITSTGTYEVEAFTQGTQSSGLNNETVELLLDIDATRTTIDSVDISNSSNSEVSLKSSFTIDLTSGSSLSLYMTASDDLGNFTPRYATFKVKQIG